MMDFVSEERVLHPALTMVPDACFRRARHDPKSSLVFHRDGIPVRPSIFYKYL